MSDPRYALLLIGDGRDRLRARTLESFYARVDVEPELVIEVDDRDHLLGFCGAIQRGWSDLIARCPRDLPYVFHLEEDWHFLRPFSIRNMAAILAGDPDLAQVALMRGPVNKQERDAGGLVAAWPDEYAARAYWDGNQASPVQGFLEHRLYFTTNPSLYRLELAYRAWPNAPDCERAFTSDLLEAGHRFACLGAGEAWVEHKGARTGTGY